MRVCLISPPTATELDDRELAETEAVRLIADAAPAGILTLAAVLEQKDIFPRIYNLNRLYYEYLRNGENRTDFCGFVARKLEGESFDVFGFGTICSTYPLTIRIAREVKRGHPEATIVLGGPQASVVDVQTLRAFEFVDYVVRGEAENTFPELLRALGGGGRLDPIPGITFRRRGDVVRNPNAPVIADLDELPLPAYHLYPELKDCRYVPLELGRGCPFACTFCSTNDFFRRRFRLKSPERVIEQMSTIQRLYGIREFDLVHDMFTVDRKRVVAFCEALLACGERFVWGCSARTDCVDEELIALMARAGCRSIFFGIETGSARLQRVIDKNLDLAEAARMIRSADSHRIQTTVSLITGFPEETMEDLGETLDFLTDSLRFDCAQPQLHLLAPLAETPLCSEYADRLALDDIFSDMAYQGWRQDPADRELIAAHPEIFPNFYSVPTPGLDRRHVKELRDFVLNGIVRFRWLLVALAQHAGGLPRVFEDWKTWRLEVLKKEFASDSESILYYSRIEFRRDFLNFVRSRCLARMGQATQALSTLLAYEGSLDMEAGVALEGREGAPRLAPGLHVVELDSDYKEIIGRLRRKQSLEQVPARPVVVAIRPNAGKRFEVVQLSDLAGRILRLCDGRRSVAEIGDLLSLRGEDTAGVPPAKACAFALELLRQEGLVAA
jgi:radical SAM superfamily enzyme YgiQ (UPF0313 family)